MKKLFLIAALAFSFMACDFTKTCEPGSECDTTNVDSVLVDTLNVDSLKVDTANYEQCHAITKKGTRCERLCDKGDTLCFQHKKM